MHLTFFQSPSAAASGEFSFIESGGGVVSSVRSQLSHEAGLRRSNITDEFEEEENSAMGRARGFKTIGANMSGAESTSNKARFDFTAAAQREEELAPAKAKRFNFSAAATPLDERKPGGEGRSARFELGATATGEGQVGALKADTMQVDDEIYCAPSLKRTNKNGDEQPELRLVRILSSAPHQCGGRVSGGLKVCLQLTDECTSMSPIRRAR
jgi:hypothetical protein